MMKSGNIRKMKTMEQRSAMLIEEREVKRVNLGCWFLTFGN
jgi:hypothetical protein